MKRKIVWAMVAACLACALAGCGSADSGSETSASGNGVYNNISTGRPVIRQE